MSSFPKVDQPCPLGVDEQKRLDGHCTRCEKSVHVLDAMSDAERRALLASACGSICVSYRMRSPRRTARFGAAMALAMVVLPAAATEVPQVGATTPEALSETPSAPSRWSSELRPRRSSAATATKPQRPRSRPTT
jgi:hypothetical protein